MLNFQIKGVGIFLHVLYTYITVFIRNAANLTLLLLKGSKLRKENKNEDFGLHWPLKIYDF
jgi:hypothetical protein